MFGIVKNTAANVVVWGKIDRAAKLADLLQKPYDEWKWEHAAAGLGLDTAGTKAFCGIVRGQLRAAAAKAHFRSTILTEAGRAVIVTELTGLADHIANTGTIPVIDASGNIAVPVKVEHKSGK